MVAMVVYKVRWRLGCANLSELVEEEEKEDEEAEGGGRGGGWGEDDWKGRWKNRSQLFSIFPQCPLPSPNSLPLPWPTPTHTHARLRVSPVPGLTFHGFIFSMQKGKKKKESPHSVVSGVSGEGRWGGGLHLGSAALQSWEAVSPCGSTTASQFSRKPRKLHSEHFGGIHSEHFGGIRSCLFRQTPEKENKGKSLESRVTSYAERLFLREYFRNVRNLSIFPD